MGCKRRGSEDGVIVVVNLKNSMCGSALFPARWQLCKYTDERREFWKTRTWFWSKPTWLIWRFPRFPTGSNVAISCTPSLYRHRWWELRLFYVELSPCVLRYCDWNPERHGSKGMWVKWMDAAWLRATDINDYEPEYYVTIQTPIIHGNSISGKALLPLKE